MSADVIFADTPVRLFFVRRSKRGPWSGLLCTDLRLGFFEAYETIGELFREATKDSLEITISERIWGRLLDLVAAIARVFNITDEDVLEAAVNQSDELAHICELYKHKLAS